MSKTLGVKITADSKQAEKEINKVTSAVNKLKKNLDTYAKAGSAISGLAASFHLVTKTVNAAVSAVNELSNAYEKQRKAEISLEQATKNNPYLLKSSSVKLKQFASELQSISTVGDEELLPFMANLANYGRTEAEIMDIVSTAVDMQASGVMDLGSAIQALNATYQGTTGTLGRQCSAVKNLTKEQLANGEAVKLLKKQYEGTAEAVTKEVGAVTQFSNKMGDVKEFLGEAASALKSGFVKFADVVTAPVQALADLRQKAKLTAEETAKTREQIEQIDRIVKSWKTGSGASAGEIKTLEKDYAAEAEKFENASKSIGRYLELLKQIENDNVNIDYEDFYKNIDALSKVEGFEWLSDLTEWDETFNKRLTKQLENTQKRIATKQKEIHKALQAQTAKENSESAKAFKAQYEETIAQEENKIELERRVGKQISETEKQQRLLNAGQSFYLKQVNEGKSINKQIEKDLSARAEKVNAVNKTQADSIKNAVSAYEDAVQKLKKEQKAHEDMGETLSEEQKAREELKVKTQAYVALVAAGGGSTQTAKKALEDIKALGKKCEAYDKLSGAIGDTEKETEAFLKAQEDALKEGGLSAGIRNTIALLDAEAAFLDKDSELYKKYLAEKKKLEEYLPKVQAAENAEAGNKFQENNPLSKSFIEEAAESYKAVHDLDVEYAALAEKEKTELAEQYGTKRRQLVMSSISQTFAATEEYLSYFSQAMSNFAQLAEQTATAEAQKQTAELEKAYANNEISEEDYYKEKEKIEKEAAEKSYKYQVAAWAMQLAQATINTAAGVMNAIATAGNIYAGIALAAAVGTLGASQIAMIASQKPRKNFATGGIVGGDSYYGDKVQANVNSGEMILNRRQQARLFDMINVGNGGPSGLNVSIKNYRGNDTAVKTSFDSGTLKIVVDRIVNEGLSSGDYNNSLRTAQNLQNGKRYVS